LAVDKLQEAVRKGQNAKRILDDEDINAILSEFGEEFMGQSYKAATLEAREEARNDLRSLDRIRVKLETLVANGREAEREIDRLNNQ